MFWILQIGCGWYTRPEPTLEDLAMRAFFAALALGLTLPALAAAQGADISFGGMRQDTSLPVEVTADSLKVDQAGGAATFDGNVLVAQGEMRLSAGRVLVVYAEGAGRIAELKASGGVTFVTPSEAAEAQEAVYDIGAGQLVLTGDVIVSQGPTALSANRMTVDLRTGTGQMEGRVRTVFQPSGN